MLDVRSLRRLEGVHPDLIRVVKCASEICETGFVVTEGLRTPERQRELFAAKATQTLNSRHITGHAVDLAAVVGGKIRWDWPLYEHLAAAMKRAAEEEAVLVEWGGDWHMRDGPHFQLPWRAYPTRQPVFSRS